MTDRLSKETLVALTNYKPIQEFVKESDYILYQRLVEILVPDVLRAVPSKSRCFLGLTFSASWFSTLMTSHPQNV